MTDDRLAGRHVVVTGGANGIGRGIAVRAARAGGDVTVFDVDTDAADETANLVRDEGGDAAVVRVDVSDESSVRDGVADAVDGLGPVHGLVNSAGVQDVLPVLETTVEDWNRHLAVNATGTFLCSQAAAEHMIDAGVEGAIVNIASTAATNPAPGQGAYGASKGAVAAFTVVLARELMEHGIRANSINPGPVDTPMFRRWLEQQADRGESSPHDALERSREHGGLDRIGQPADIGHLAVFLLSDEGDWITSESFTIRGGVHL